MPEPGTALDALGSLPCFGNLLALSFLSAPRLCSNPREMENHMKATLTLCVMCSCQRHKPEVSVLAGDPPPLHSWAERHFTEHNFSKLKSTGDWVSVEDVSC